MARDTDVRCTGVSLTFLPVKNRVPLKFGREIATAVTVARVAMRVEDATGRSAVGWGETPLGVQWTWPGTLPHELRDLALRDFAVAVARAWERFEHAGDPIAVGHAFLEHELPRVLAAFNAAREAPVPRLAALVCASPFDIALHDAFGVLHSVPAYETYNERYMDRDLSAYLEPLDGSSVSFGGLYPKTFLVPAARSLTAWHLVGGTDPLSPQDLTGQEPDDGYPVLLADWIRRDGLMCLKVKLRGNDEGWDFERLIRVAAIGRELGVVWLTADFNCTVSEPGYVCRILDRLLAEQPLVHQMLLYVEQPFGYDLEAEGLDVHAVSARKPLFMDESAHDWRLVRLGRSLGWTGVALKTCKTQTGALLSLCWARAHGMTLMVQDLTNPMLAQITHALLAAHAGTIMGIETNSMQFCPGASGPEARVHPGLYRRRDGRIDLGTIGGPGFGYRVDEIERVLPAPAYGAV